MKKLIVLAALIPSLALAARDGSGNYTLPGYPVSVGQAITSAWANAWMADVQTAIQDSLSRSGAGGMISAFTLANGAAGAPSLAFTSELTTGLYRAGAADPRLTISGSDAYRFLNTGLYGSSTGGGTMYRIPNFIEISMFVPSKMINNQLCARLGITASTRILASPPAVTFVQTPPAGSTVIQLKKRTAGGVVSNIGTFTWAPGGYFATMSFVADVDFGVGDYLEVWGPATADANFADMSITIQARRL